MLEAYDLLPVMECLKLPEMDAVESCMDALEPWLNINGGGDVAFSQNAINGFIGGTVGVVGTVVATFVKKAQVKDRLKCTYCAGTGQIICGICLDRGTVSTLNVATGQWELKECQSCEGSGTVVCINCQGSGTVLPEDFLQKLGDSEAGFSDDDYIGLFDEVKFPTVGPAAEELPKTGTDAAGEPATPTTRTPVGSATSTSKSLDPVDPSGGLG